MADPGHHHGSLKTEVEKIHKEAEHEHNVKEKHVGLVRLLTPAQITAKFAAAFNRLATACVRLTLGKELSL
jgi:hypothetical protein